MEKYRISLISLEGIERCYLELERLPNGDFFVEMRGQTLEGKIEMIRGQIPSAFNGGGDEEDYSKMCKIFEVVRQTF